MLLLLCLVRSKHHFKILGSKVHLRKSSSLRRCHYDSSPSLRLLGSKGVLGAVCVHHGRLGGRRQMQAIARRATSPPPPPPTPTMIKKGKIVPSYDMKYPKNNYVSFHVNEWMNEWYGLDLWCCILNFELLRLVSIDIWQEIRILEHYTILWSSTDLGCSWIINPKTILSKLKNTQASFSSKMFGWWKRLKSRCSLAKYEKMQTRLIEPNWVS